MGSITFSLLLAFRSTFISLLLFYTTLKINGVPPLHPLLFLFFTTLYIFPNLGVQTKRKELAGNRK